MDIDTSASFVRMLSTLSSALSISFRISAVFFFPCTLFTSVSVPLDFSLPLWYHVCKGRGGGRYRPTFVCVLEVSVITLRLLFYLLLELLVLCLELCVFLDKLLKAPCLFIGHSFHCLLLSDICRRIPYLLGTSI